MRMLASRFGLAALLTGCSFADAASDANVCQTNADCGEGEVCDAELVACVSDSRADYSVVLRVTAAATETSPASPPTRFGPFPIEDSVSARTLTVEGAQPISGLVALREGENGELQPLRAELLIRARSSRAGPPPETRSVTASAEYLSEVDPPTNFATTLGRDTSYEVEVVPVAETTAQIAPRTFEVSAEEVASGRVELLYETERVFGELQGHDGQGVDGATVRAVHPETGEALSGRVVVGPGGGFMSRRFELLVDTALAAEGEVPWLIETGPSTELPWFPIWVADPMDTSYDSDDIRVNLPELPALVPVEVTVESEAESNVIRVVGDATVQFEAELTLLRADGEETTARATRSGVTSAEGSNEGRLTVELLAGDYQVVAIPSDDDPALAPRVDSFRAIRQPPGTTQRGVTFALPLRSHLRGTVTDASGRPLPNVSVAGVQLEDDERLPGAVRGRSSSSVTDLDGAYLLPLDPGVYDVVYETGEGASYPWSVQPAQVVDSPDGHELDVQLAAPVVLRGEVRFESGREPAGAVVSAFAEFDDDDHDSRYLQIGRATVLDDGSYELYLPASLSGSR